MTRGACPPLTRRGARLLAVEQVCAPACLALVPFFPRLARCPPFLLRLARLLRSRFAAGMADAYKFASLGYAAAATATPATWGFTSASGCSETAGYICCKDIDNCCICDCIVGWRCKSCETTGTSA